MHNRSQWNLNVTSFKLPIIQSIPDTQLHGVKTALRNNPPLKNRSGLQYYFNRNILFNTHCQKWGLGSVGEYKDPLLLQTENKMLGTIIYNTLKLDTSCYWYWLLWNCWVVSTILWGSGCRFAQKHFIFASLRKKKKKRGMWKLNSQEHCQLQSRIHNCICFMIHHKQL